MIDVHTHAVPGPAAASALPASMYRLDHVEEGIWQVVIDGNPVRRVDSRAFDAADRVLAMESEGVDHHLVSPTPFLFRYDRDPEDTHRLTRATNEWIAHMVSQEPQRLTGLGSVTLQDPARAVADTLQAVDELGLDGIEIGTHAPGQELDSPANDPLWDELNARRSIVFVHPYESRLRDVAHRAERFALGYPMATGVAFAAIAAGELPRRYPEIRWLLAHGGGSAPSLLGRLDCSSVLETGDPPVEPALEVLRRCWVDSLVYDPAQLAALLELVGPDRVLLGTDFPFAARERPPGQALLVGTETGLLDPTMIDRVGRRNAESFLRSGSPQI